MERKFALGGRGDGPLVPTGGSAKVVVLGALPNERITIISEHGEVLELNFNGEPFLVPCDWSFVRISYAGEARPVFFVEND